MNAGTCLLFFPRALAIIVHRKYYCPVRRKLSVKIAECAETISPPKMPGKRDSSYLVTLIVPVLIVSVVACALIGTLLPVAVALSQPTPPTIPDIPGEGPLPPSVQVPPVESAAPIPFNIWDAGKITPHSKPRAGALGEWPLVIWVYPGYSGNLSGNIAYVSDPVMRNVYTLNTTSGELSPAFFVSDGPEYCILSNDGNKAYISTGRELVVASTSTGFLIDVFSFDKNITFMCMSADGSRLIVYTSVGSEPGALDVIDTRTDRRIGTIKRLSYSWGMDPGSSTVLYLCDYFRCKIAFVTTGGDQIGYWGQALDCSAPELYAATYVWNDNTVYSDAGYAADVAMSPDYRNLYVSRSGNSNFSIVSLSYYGKFKEVPMPGKNSTGVAVSPDGSRVYVANYDTGQIVVLNTTGDILGEIRVNDRPLRVEISGDGNGLVVNYDGSGLELIDLATGNIRGYDLPRPGIWFPGGK